MDKWVVEFVKVKDGAAVLGSFWSCTVEQDGASAAILAATDKMIDTVEEDPGYYRVFRATNNTIMAMKTLAPVKV